MLVEEKSTAIVLGHSNSDNWEHDPSNPRRWSLTRKWLSMGTVTLYIFVMSLAGALMAPALPELAKKYDITDSSILAMTLSISFLSLGLFPLVIAPLSEMYGRKWVLHIGNVLLGVSNLACAYAPNAGSLIAFRFLVGVASACPMAVAGGVINDLFSDREKAVAMAIFIFMPLVAAAAGPVIGGIITESMGIKYIFIAMVISCSVASLFGILCLRETYSPVIGSRLAKKASHLKNAAVARLLAPTNESIWHILWLNLSRPMILLTRSFICFTFSMYLALIYGIFLLMFTTFSTLFSDVYHFSQGAVGLSLLGPGIGSLIGAVFSGYVSKKIYAMLADKNDGKGKPEMRIPSLIFGSFFIPIGLFWCGWSAVPKIHWIMPMIGGGIFEFGFIIALIQVQLYLVDAFAFPASALSASSVFQSLLGFTFPLFGQDMYVKLGYGGGYSLLAGLAIVIGIPFPIWIWYKGEGIRKRSTVFLSRNDT